MNVSAVVSKDLKHGSSFIPPIGYAHACGILIMFSAKRSPVAGLRIETLVKVGSMTVTPGEALHNSNVNFP